MEEAPKVKVKYNKELLDACLERDGATLVGEYEKLNRDSVIQFVCKCGMEGEKNFRVIYEKGGMFCKECTTKNCFEKVSKTNLKKYGVTYPLQNKDILEKTRLTSENKYGVRNPFQNKNILEKSKLTLLEKYGVKSPIQNKVIKEKIKKTNLEKYGVEYSLQSEEVKEKGKKTILNNFGVKHPSQNKEVKEKIKKTTIKNYGVECSLQSEEIKEKIKQTNLEKYGVEYPLQNNDIKEKMKLSMTQKYGVEHVLQNPEIFAKQQKNAKKFKTYTMPSGAIRQVQGYEPFALDTLVKHYREDEILTERGSVPRIPYKTSEGKQRYYFPDIYIPHENKIIEVKSTWTYKCKSDNVQEKIQATTAAGYAYELWCFNAKGERVDVAASPEADPPRPSRIQRRPPSSGVEEVESEAPESEKEESL